LSTARLAVGVMRPLARAVDDEWARERNAVVDVGSDAEHPLRLPRSPFRFSEVDAGTTGRPAWHGQHNRKLLRELLGLTDREIDRLSRDGVVVERPV